MSRKKRSPAHKQPDSQKKSTVEGDGAKQREMRQRGTNQSGAKQHEAKQRETKRQKVWLWILAGVVILAGLMVGLKYWRDNRGKDVLGTADVVKIETNKGLIVMEVYPDLVPTTVANFESLATSGFYDGLVWHRVENWVVQTGDPEGTGFGGSEKTIKLEINPKLSNVRGAVGMARSQDPNSASSQFYILKQDAKSLDGSYAIFGKVISGMDVVDKLAIGDKMIKVTVEKGQAKSK